MTDGWFPPGVYTVDNPVYINRSARLFMHGGDRIATRIVPKNPGHPMFIVEAATIIDVAGLAFEGYGGIGGTTLNDITWQFRNTSPVTFEMLDCTTDFSYMDIEGPGTFTLQGTLPKDRGRVNSPIVINNPNADFVMVGGDINSGVATPRGAFNDPTQLFHVWQKQGRLRIYGTNFEGAFGVADVRIETGSALGPHVMTWIRSEGSNTYKVGTLQNALLYVPSTPNQVNVVVQSCGSAANTGGYSLNHFVDYSGAGTLWLLGNTSMVVSSLVVGTANRGATVVAIGNGFRGGNPISSYSFPITGATIIAAGNEWRHKDVTGLSDLPYTRRITPESNISTVSPPVIPAPTFIDRPVLNAALKGMYDAKRDCKARGDGVTDDTAALKCLANKGKLIYYPAGTYLVSGNGTGFCNHALGLTEWGPGGWIAGAGKNRTIIKRTGDGNVWSTDGAGFLTVQGITFQGPAYTSNTKATVDIEFNPTYGFATQELQFYDCAFTGGKYAVGVNLVGTAQCSENMYINSSFSNAKYGLGVGNFNAFNNLVYSGSFSGNVYATGHGEEGQQGGTWGIIHGSITGGSGYDFNMALSGGNEGLYFNDLKTNSNGYWSRVGTSGYYMMFFDQCTLSPRSASNPVFNTAASGGLFFLGSTMPSGHIQMNSSVGSPHLVNLKGNIPYWSSNVIGATTYEFPH
jgi:hypothetical protein